MKPRSWRCCLHLGAEVEREFDAAHWRALDIAFELDPEENLDIVENRVEAMLSKQVEVVAMQWWSAFAWAELHNP